MGQHKLTGIRFDNGIWEGHLSGSGWPDIEVRYLDQPVEGVAVAEADNGWTLQVPVPLRAISEGVHTFLIYDAASNTRLGDFTVIAGAPAADDLRAEVALLRAELDMLKRAFRRHCADTAD
ncbi:hypothetical protein AVO45_11625 [Ruegeria marisrubri]|uniref:Uncharacterized protein n=1 Tax=Ruegeria marisrubri TaxID=1685379 RepID=A0A0X3TT66_9RHOB|nr:hypothetical protein [Ruegeria marisrubri]KUJ76440.1 hypothetical protein AVO45_11625 [Ruegeria marisrubri]